MSDIVVVLGSNTHFAPYYYKYEKMLLDRGIEFDLIIWDREQLNENTRANETIRFTLKDEGNNGNFFKVYKFFAFSSFVKRVIRNRKYKKIIFLGLSGCAPTLGSFYYSKQYKNNCWLDIRDHQYEWFKPYYYLEKLVIESTFCTAISSKGFESFLPKWRYTVIHNVDPNMDYIMNNLTHEISDKIRISFIGNVRYYSENISFINCLANDNRFLIQYFGPGSENLIEYCQNHKINNVVFDSKRFDYMDTINYYAKTDIINNIYGNSRIETRTALSNKLYYSIYLKKPIIVSPGTYMEEITQKYGIGLSFEPSDSFGDELYSRYVNGSLQYIEESFESAKKKVEFEEIILQRQFDSFLKQ